MKLSGTEFLRRFALHFLPDGFHRMRHYGFLANRNKQKIRKLQADMGAVRPKPEVLSWQELSKQHLGFDPNACPHCKTPTMVVVETFAARPPPRPNPAHLEPINPCSF